MVTKAQRINVRGKIRVWVGNKTLLRRVNGRGNIRVWVGNKTLLRRVKGRGKIRVRVGCGASNFPLMKKVEHHIPNIYVLFL